MHDLQLKSRSNGSCLILIAVLVSVFVSTGCDSAHKPSPIPAGSTLEVHALAATGTPNAISLADPKTGESLLLELLPVVATADVATVERSKLEIESLDGSPAILQPALNVVLTPEGAARLLKATTALQGQTIAVVIDGKIVSTPRVIVPINGSFRISSDVSDVAFVTAIESITGNATP
ncbi:MAG: SecDF P1 head subdomain-containing protein [Rubripirellula sp.]